MTTSVTSKLFLKKTLFLEKCDATTKQGGIKENNTKEHKKTPPVDGVL